MNTAIVIGGGIAGCSTAYALAKRGIQVTLIERNTQLASEASGNPLAVLYPRLSGQNTALEQLNILGYQYTLQLLKELGSTECKYHGCGVIQLATDASQSKKQIEVAAKYQDILALLTPTDLSKIAGIDLHHAGLYFPQAGGIHLPDLCKTLTQHADIQVVRSTAAIHLQPTTKQTWQVSTSGESYEADSVVIANGHDANNLHQCAHIPFTAIRGQVSVLVASEQSNNLRTIICGEGYIGPAIDGLHCLGATFSAHDTDHHVRMQDHNSNLKQLKAISDQLYQTLKDSVVSGRVAWRSQTPDYLPAVGQLLDIDKLKNGKYFYNDSPDKLPWLKGLYINAGHGAKGFLSAPLCAEIIAHHISATPLNVPISLRNALQGNRFILRKMGFKQLAQQLLGSAD